MTVTKPSDVYRVEWHLASGETAEELLTPQYAEWLAANAKLEQPERNLSLKSRRRVAEALHYHYMRLLETERITEIWARDGSLWAVPTAAILRVRVDDPQTTGRKVQQSSIGFTRPVPSDSD